MNQKTKNNILTSLGIIYIALGIISFYNAIAYTETANILWFSYISFFLIGVGLLTRKAWLIASQLVILFIPYIIWNIDFFHILFTGNTLWGITDYFFTPRKTFAQLISLQHIFTIPVSLFAIYLIELKKKDFWKFSVAQIMILFILVRTLSSAEENINCAFENCLPFTVSDPLYSILWFLGYGIMIGSTSYFLTKIKAFNKK